MAKDKGERYDSNGGLRKLQPGTGNLGRGKVQAGKITGMNRKRAREGGRRGAGRGGWVGRELVVGGTQACRG